MTDDTVIPKSMASKDRFCHGHYLTRIVRKCNTIDAFSSSTNTPCFVFSYQLKPRSDRNLQQVDIDPPLSPKSKSNPFGSAKPREQVLRQRGVDVKSLDAKFEEKARVSRYSEDQEAQIAAIQKELTHFEALWREANEKELPEELYRVQAEAKREELTSLMKKFSTTPEKSTEGKELFSSNEGFVPVVQKQSSRRGHYLPAKEDNKGYNAFTGMSRHRFGTKAN